MNIQLNRAYEPAEVRDGGRLRERVKMGPVTFIFAAKDEEHSSARLLKEFLEGEG